MFPKPCLRFWLFALLLLVPLGWATGAAAQTVLEAATEDELLAALRKAGKGDVIRLAPGNYGELELTAKAGFSLDFPPKITITSGDPERPARFTGLKMHKVSNLIFDGVIFDYRFEPGQPAWLRAFQCAECADVEFRNSVFDGDRAKGVSAKEDGLGYAIGLSIRDSRGITIEGNEFNQFIRGAVFERSQDLTIVNNDLHSLRSDGLDFAQVKDVLIEGNYIHDFQGLPDWQDHRDMIQFWTNKTDQPTERVIIRGNILNSGMGPYTQTIFMRNEEVDTGRAEREMFYKDIEIVDNVIINAHLHGITVGETDGLVIRNNTLIHNTKSDGKTGNPPLWIPRIQVSSKSTDVVIERNAAAEILGLHEQKDWQVRDNILIQDRGRTLPNFYTKVFENPLRGDPTNLSTFAYAKGGPLQGSGIGSPYLEPDRIPELPEN